MKLKKIMLFPLLTVLLSGCIQFHIFDSISSRESSSESSLITGNPVAKEEANSRVLAAYQANKVKDANIYAEDREYEIRKEQSIYANDELEVYVSDYYKFNTEFKATGLKSTAPQFYLKEFSNYQKIEDEYETKFSGTNSKLYYKNGWLYLDYDNYSRNGPGASTERTLFKEKENCGLLNATQIEAIYDEKDYKDIYITASQLLSKSEWLEKVQTVEALENNGTLYVTYDLTKDDFINVYVAIRYDADLSTMTSEEIANHEILVATSTTYYHETIDFREYKLVLEVDPACYVANLRLDFDYTENYDLTEELSSFIVTQVDIAKGYYITRTTVNKPITMPVPDLEDYKDITSAS